jgi:hypothetical protein
MKLSEFLQRQGEFANIYWNMRATHGASGYEHWDIVVGLGKVAINGTGVYVGNNNGTPTLPNGEIVELDFGQPLTDLAVMAASSLGVLNELADSMDGGSDRFLPEKADFISQGLEPVAYRLGLKIINFVTIPE